MGFQMDKKQAKQAYQEIHNKITKELTGLNLNMTQNILLDLLCFNLICTSDTEAQAYRQLKNILPQMKMAIYNNFKHRAEMMLENTKPIS